MAKQPRKAQHAADDAQVQKMQRDMELAQEELQPARSSRPPRAAAWCTVKMSGDLQVREVRIDPAAVDPEDVEMLADMVLAAVNEALRKAQELAERKMGGATAGLDLGALGGLGLPGL